MRIGIVTGSLRPGSCAPQIVQAIEDELALCTNSDEISTTVINVSDYPRAAVVEIPFSYQGDKDPVLQALHTVLCEQDAFIFVTGEYNHAPLPGLLALIDNFGRDVWNDKAAALVSYGGQPPGGARALFTLRNVLAEVGMFVVPKQVSITLQKTSAQEQGLHLVLLVTQLCRLCRGLEQTAKTNEK